MIFPTYLMTYAQEHPGVNVTVDVNTIFYAGIIGLFIIIWYTVRRYTENVDKKFDQFDSRMDKMEINQAKIMTKLKID